MTKHQELLADVLSAEPTGAPGADELVDYARRPETVAPEAVERVERYLAASPAHRDRFRALAGPDWVLLGSCLCGGIRYAVAGPLPAIGHCHCRVCRKAHGAAFGSFALVEAARLRWTRGEELLSRYVDGPDRERLFCRRCGTTLTGASPAGALALAVATLDVDPVSRPALHANVASKAPWFEITDDVAQQPAGFGEARAWDPSS